MASSNKQLRSAFTTCLQKTFEPVLSQNGYGETWMDIFSPLRKDIQDMIHAGWVTNHRHLRLWQHSRTHTNDTGKAFDCNLYKAEHTLVLRMSFQRIATMWTKTSYANKDAQNAMRIRNGFQMWLLACMHAYIHTHSRIYMQTHKHTYMHMYSHTCHWWSAFMGLDWGPARALRTVTWRFDVESNGCARNCMRMMTMMMMLTIVITSFIQLCWNTMHNCNGPVPY